LHIEWTYSDQLHRRSTIAGLAQRYRETLQSLMNDCLYGTGSRFTPADFPLAKLSQDELDLFLTILQPPEQDARLRFLENVEDIYELSSVQQGLLFHSLYAPQGGMYIVQVCC